MMNLSSVSGNTLRIVIHLFLLACISAVLAQSVQAQTNLSQKPCSFEDLSLPPGSRIFAAGAYKGRELNYQIDQSGHQATQFDVTVHSPENPVVLMLGAYEPSIWNLSWTVDTEIIAVLVSGYHAQALAGIPESTPVLNSSYDNRGPCKYFYVTQRDLHKLNPISRAVFDRPVDRVFLAKQGSVHIGSAIEPGAELLQSKEKTPESFYRTDVPLAGPAGIEKAVADGILRPATKEDFRAWLRVQERQEERDIPPVEGGLREDIRLPHLHNAYVILKEFTIPAGLYGAHSATFLLPEDVVEPEGTLGHSSLLRLRDGSCVGVVCDMQR